MNFGIIYKITFNDGYYYVGSTEKTIMQRLKKHIYNTKNDKLQTKFYKKLRDNINDAKIKCMFKICFTDKKDRYEQEENLLKFVKDNELCLNKNRAIKTREEHNEYMREYMKKRYHKQKYNVNI